MILSIFLIVLSFAILTGGAELLVRGASSLGLRLGLNPLVIGLTIVALGTSAPELAVSIKAALQGTGDIAMGNVIGSNLINIALILGLSALVRPLAVHWQVIRFDTPLMVFVTFLFAFFLLAGGGLLRWEAAILFSGIVAYVWHSLLKARRNAAQAMESGEDPLDTLGVPSNPTRLPVSFLLVGIGMGLLVVGARLLVDNAVGLARAWNVSEAVIGLTIVALGTSLPELATSVVASIKKETDIAVGNIVGSNIFNILCIAGVTGLISPISILGIRRADLFWMIGVSLLIVPLMRSGLQLGRKEGAILLSLYAAYLFTLWPN